MNVMTAAWAIARRGAATFGGSVKEYFAAALKQAWANVKAAKARVDFELSADTRKFRTWLAKIEGPHATYKLDRKFINPDGTSEYGDKVFRLSPGFYEYNNGRKREFFQVIDGTVRTVDQSYILSAVA